MPLVTAKCSIVSNTMGGGISDYWIVSQTTSDPTRYVEDTHKGLATQSDDSIIIAYWSTDDVDSNGNLVIQRYDTTGEIETFDVEWAYQYWTDLGADDAPTTDQKPGRG